MFDQLFVKIATVSLRLLAVSFRVNSRAVLIALQNITPVTPDKSSIPVEEVGAEMVGTGNRVGGPATSQKNHRTRAVETSNSAAAPCAGRMPIHMAGGLVTQVTCGRG